MKKRHTTRFSLRVKRSYLTLCIIDNVDKGNFYEAQRYVKLFKVIDRKVKQQD